MQFNTYIYILLFLPVVLLGYFTLNKISFIIAKVFLVIFSLIFYLYAGIKGFIWLLVSISVNYLFVVVLRQNKSKVILSVGIIVNIAILFYFKYLNFVIASIDTVLQDDISSLEIIQPIGISFYTFQQISYLVDTYREETLGNNVLDYLVYVTFFPKVLMGPIVKQSEIISQFNEEQNRVPITDNLVIGIQMFVIGLSKKVILADNFAKAVKWAFNEVGIYNISSMDILLVMIAYSFQIYFDFSGYSDMAIASAKMLNIDMPSNFDSPYKAYSIRDFWKRWHISLTRFLTEYIYIPLGGE